LTAAQKAGLHLKRKQRNEPKGPPNKKKKTDHNKGETKLSKRDIMAIAHQV
jgi:hypothetical protein